MQAVKKGEILGVRIDPVGWSEVMAFCELTLLGNMPKQIVTLNGEFVLLAQKNESFRQTIKNADLVIPDSTNIVWCGRLKGIPLKEVTQGSELVNRVAKLAAKNHRSVFLLGGRGEVPEKAAAELKRMYPSLKIAGTSDGNPDDPTIAGIISMTHADIVLVAYGAPKQDLWIARNRLEAGAKLLIGVGGTLDMLAGILPRAPRITRRLHLEWLWRLALQPSRLPRIWRALVVFPWRALCNN